MLKCKRWMMTAILAGAMIGLAACDNGGNGNTGASNAGSKVESSAPAESQAQVSKGGYSFDANGVAITADMDMDEVKSKIGEYKSVFDAPSCAGEGVDYIYNYGSFEIETYPSADGKNLIGFITLKDDMVSTKEGIDLSMTKADVIKAYGDSYEEAGSSVIYEKGGMKLTFVFEDDKMISIQYASSVVG